MAEYQKDLENTKSDRWKLEQMVQYDDCGMWDCDHCPISKIIPQSGVSTCGLLNNGTWQELVKDHLNGIIETEKRVEIWKKLK